MTAQKIKIKILPAFGFALLMALGANCFLYLPFTPVPMTFQVLTVLLGSILLGYPYAFYSQLIYITLGFMGMGVFAGFSNAYIALAGPTAGYIIGFVAASLVTSYLYSRTKTRKGLWAALLSGLATIYILGYVHMLIFFWGSSVLGLDTAVQTFKTAIAPFIAVDIIKIFIVVNLVKPWLNKERGCYEKNNG